MNKRPGGREGAMFSSYAVRRVVSIPGCGRRQASLKTGQPEAVFPEACPWPLARMMEEDFWPDAG